MPCQTFNGWNRVRFRWSAACEVAAWAWREYGAFYAVGMFGFVLFWHPFCRLALWLTAGDPELHADIQETINRLAPTLATPFAVVTLDTQGEEAE